MKSILFICLCLSASFIKAQTAIIAHKSHSGTVVDFFTDPSSNFGEPGPQLIQVVRLNDSTYIEVYSEFSGVIYHDTIRKHRKIRTYHEDVDSIYQQEYYKNHVEYINLMNTADTGRVKTPSLQLQKMIEVKEVQKPNYNRPAQEPNPKKKKRSYLLFLFGITGGGLLIVRALNRMFTPQIIS